MDLSQQLENTVRKTSKQLTAPSASDMPTGIVRYAVVTAKAAGVCTIQYAGDTAIPNVKSLYDNFSVGDTVLVQQYGTEQVVLGALRDNYSGEPKRNIANAIVNVNSGGACKGKYGDGSGSGVNNLPVTTTPLDVYLGVASVPVKPNRLLSVKFSITGVDRVGGQYIFATLRANWNGTGFGDYRRYVMYEAGAGTSSNYPVFQEWVFATPTNAATVSFQIYCSTSAGTAYIYRYATYTGQDESWMTVDDIGTAEDFLAQGGVSG